MQDRIAFDEFVVEVRRRTLLRRGRPQPLGERAMATLLVLADRPGEIVSKRELLDAVWPDAVVGEDSLVKAVGEVRAALGDSAAEPRYIQTVPRRGYRFIGAIVSDDAADGGSAATTRTRAFLIGATVLLIATLAGVWLILERGSARQPPFTSKGFVRLQGLPRGAMKPAFAPTGDLMATVIPDPMTGEHALWLAGAGDTAPLRLTRGVEVRGPSPVFAADGASILFTTYLHDPGEGLKPEVWAVPTLGGEVRMVLQGVSAASPAPNGSSLAYSRVTAEGTSLRVRDPSGAETILAEPGYWPRFSPDGRWIAYTTSNPEGGAGDVWIVRPDGSRRLRMTTDESQIYGLCWTPDSRWVLYSSDTHSTGDIFAVSIPGGEVHQVTSGPGSCTAPAVSADGRRLVFAYASLAGSLVAGRSPNATDLVLLEGSSLRDFALSRDGRFVVAVIGGSDGEPRTVVLDAATGEQRTISGLDVESVRWSPDGRSVLAVAPSPDGAERWIWALPVNGGLPEPVIRGPGRWSVFDPSPDGALIAVGERMSDGSVELVLLDLDGGGRTPVLKARGLDGLRWSPDGRLLVFSGGERPDDAVSAGIWLVEVASGELRRVVADGDSPTWVDDGRSLLFARYEEHAGLWRLDLDEGEPRRVHRPVQDLLKHQIAGLDAGANGTPVVSHLKTGIADLYVLEADDD